MTGIIQRVGRAGVVAAGLTLTATLLPGATGTAVAEPSVQSQLAQVRAATDTFHDTDAAMNAHYLPMLPCFDSPAGGMGQHFINGAYVGTVDLTHPAALVYEPRSTGYKLVAVEYVVPGPADMTPPVLLGQPFTYLESLGVWKLHAWIWRPNPAGMFADFNPDIQKCPTS